MMEKFLMLYYPLLDPIMSNPDEVLNIYVRQGCRLIEVSLPCENPGLDGAVIQNSMKRILEKSTINEMFEAVKRVKKQFPYIKIQLVSYIETIEKTGFPIMADLCKYAHVDYVLSPDASDEQLARLDRVFAEIYEIPVIRFLPYSGNEKLLERAKKGKGYLFLQSGNTRSGGSQEIGGELKQKIAYLRNNAIDIPIVAGFGIKRREQVQACYQCGADGVAIGSGLMEYIAKSETEQYLSLLAGNV